MHIPSWVTLHEQPGFKILSFVWPSELLLAPCADDAELSYKKDSNAEAWSNVKKQPEPGTLKFFIKVLKESCSKHPFLRNPPRAARLQNDILHLAFRITFTHPARLMLTCCPRAARLQNSSTYVAFRIPFSFLCF